MIRRLTLRVLEEALDRCREWADAGLPVAVSVNLATPHLLDRGLPDDVARALARAGVEPRLLELEVTERMLMSNPRRVGEIIPALAGTGVRFAVDDFGSGYSSLGQLARLPLHALKIDGSFVAGLAGRPDASLVVRTAVRLGRALGLTVVAEGVETAAAWREVAALGCDLAQGYHVARPLRADETAELLLLRNVSGGVSQAARPAGAVPLPAAADPAPR